MTDAHITPQPAQLSGRAERAVAEAKGYLSENFRETVSLERLAELTHTSKFHLCRMFTQSVGVSPVTYRTSLRVEEAKVLLKRGRPLAHVAYDVGFADQAHLTRLFKRHVGVTPGQYQAKSA